MPAVLIKETFDSIERTKEKIYNFISPYYILFCIFHNKDAMCMGYGKSAPNLVEIRDLFPKPSLNWQFTAKLNQKNCLCESIYCIFIFNLYNLKGLTFKMM